MWHIKLQIVIRFLAQKYKQFMFLFLFSYKPYSSYLGCLYQSVLSLMAYIYQHFQSPTHLARTSIPTRRRPSTSHGIIILFWEIEYDIKLIHAALLIPSLRPLWIRRMNVSKLLYSASWISFLSAPYFFSQTLYFGVERFIGLKLEQSIITLYISVTQSYSIRAS